MICSLFTIVRSNIIVVESSELLIASDARWRLSARRRAVTSRPRGARVTRVTVRPALAGHCRPHSSLCLDD